MNQSKISRDVEGYKSKLNITGKESSAEDKSELFLLKIDFQIFGIFAEIELLLPEGSTYAERSVKTLKLQYFKPI